MITSYALNAINRFIKGITGNDAVIGGKIIRLGDCFRQTLPVDPRAPPAALIGVCIKRSHLWGRVHHLRLTRNMKANINEPEVSKWLLSLGNSSLNGVLQDVPQNTIDLPSSCYQTSLVLGVFNNCIPKETEK